MCRVLIFPGMCLCLFSACTLFPDTSKLGGYRRRRRERQRSMLEEKESINKALQEQKDTEGKSNKDANANNLLRVPSQDGSQTPENSEERLPGSTDNVDAVNNDNVSCTCSRLELRMECPLHSQQSCDMIKCDSVAPLQSSIPYRSSRRDQPCDNATESGPQRQTVVTVTTPTGETNRTVTAHPPVIGSRHEGDNISLASTTSSLSLSSIATTDSNALSDAAKRQSVSSLSDLEHMGKSRTIQGWLEHYGDG